MGKVTWALLALVLVGCATAQVWDKPGATDRDFQMTVAKCRMAAASYQRQGPATVQSAANSYAFMDDCMMAEGWFPVADR